METKAHDNSGDAADSLNMAAPRWRRVDEPGTAGRVALADLPTRWPEHAPLRAAGNVQ